MIRGVPLTSREYVGNNRVLDRAQITSEHPRILGRYGSARRDKSVEEVKKYDFWHLRVWG